ncbi:hypothetical protein BJX65DRAFT_318104 [Aspergillus insuetus]
MEPLDAQGAVHIQNWRIPKACQMCRGRKIRCDGKTPCNRCMERNLPCEYRNKPRQRPKKRKLATEMDALDAATDEGMQPTLLESDWIAPTTTTAAPGGVHGMKTPPRLPHSSVTATHLASPGHLMQLYYGPTSNFSLMQAVYRDLIPGYTENMSETARGVVEEGSAGLDLFQFRNIFFGLSDSSSSHADAPVFVPYPVAKALLQRFLLTLYHLMPFQPQEVYRQKLDELYNSVPGFSNRAPGRRVVLVAMAVSALNTEHHRLAALLFDSVKREVAMMDDLVNVEMVQHALFENEKGHPNSAFLHLGVAARKAICAGFHKVTTRDTFLFEETQRTFWALYSYEILVSFFLGRSTVLSWIDIEIPVPNDPFLYCLVRLSQIMSKSTNEVYGKSHESFRSMEQAAASVRCELEAFEPLMQQNLGVRIDSDPLPQEQGVCQTMLTTLYNHTLLLTYRAFLILRGKWRSLIKGTEQGDMNHGTFREQKNEIAGWLDDTCGYAIAAARNTIHHISQASCANPLIQELQYNAFFIGSSAFALIYDMLHDPAAATVHIPWINVGMQSLNAMRSGEPITGTMRAINLALTELSRVEERQAQAQPTVNYGESTNTVELGQDWKFDPSAVNLDGFFSWPVFDPCV